MDDETEQLYFTDKNLAARFKLGRTTIWEMAADGRLPMPVKLSERTTRWRLADLKEWEAGLKPASAHLESSK